MPSTYGALITAACMALFVAGGCAAAALRLEPT